MRWMHVFGVAAVVYGFFCHSTLSQAPQAPLYRDSSQPVAKRIEDLLGRMTLKEKAGQMNMPCVYINSLGRDPAAK